MTQFSTTDKNGDARSFPTTITRWMPGDPTSTYAFNLMVERENTLRGGKMASIPGAMATGVTAVPESGGEFHVWNYLGWGISGEDDEKTIVNVSRHAGVLPESFSTHGLKYRIIHIELRWFSDESLTEITYRMPQQAEVTTKDDGTPETYEVFSQTFGVLPAYYVFKRSFYSNDGDDGTNNDKCEITLSDDTFTFWVDATSGDLKVKYDGSAHGPSEYHAAFYACIKYSPKMA